MLPFVLSVGYIFIALRCKGANSRHIMQEFGEKFSYFFVARGLMGRIVQKVCVFLRGKVCFKAIYCSICTKKSPSSWAGDRWVFGVIAICYRYPLCLFPDGLLNTYRVMGYLTRSIHPILIRHICIRPAALLLQRCIYSSSCH